MEWDLSFPCSWIIELDFSVSVFEFRQLSYLFEDATRMLPEDRPLFVETSLSPFYSKILAEKLLQGFLKSLVDNEDSPVPCTVAPPLTAEDFKRQEDARRVSLRFIVSRLKKVFGDSPMDAPLVSFLLMVDCEVVNASSILDLGASLASDSLARTAVS